MNPLRIFISSVQKELELERAAVAGLISSDPFPLQHCVPVLFEKEPPAARPAPRGYLAPLIAQTLATLGVMEQRGSGFARMQDAMLNHGLDAPKLSQEDGYFVVTLAGPAGNYDRLKVPAGASGPVTPAMEAQLNERQRKAVAEVLAAGSISSGWMIKNLKITYDTANRDLIGLAKMNILVRQGRGRASKYVFVSTNSPR
jgi:predicted HTH transcriptional regulator